MTCKTWHPAKTCIYILVTDVGMLMNCNDVHMQNVPPLIVWMDECSANITDLSFEQKANAHAPISVTDWGMIDFISNDPSDIPLRCTSIYNLLEFKGSKDFMAYILDPFFNILVNSIKQLNEFSTDTCEHFPR
jgi:hypothetical protein